MPEEAPYECSRAQSCYCLASAWVYYGLTVKANGHTNNGSRMSGVNMTTTSAPVALINRNRAMTIDRRPAAVSVLYMVMGSRGDIMYPSSMADTTATASEKPAMRGAGRMSHADR